MSLALVSMLAVALAPPALQADVVPEAPLAAPGAELRLPGTDAALAVDAPGAVGPVSIPLALPGGRAVDGHATAAPPATGQAHPVEERLAQQAAVRGAASVSLLAALTALGWAVLRAFGWAPLLPFFSRIEDGDLANHPARRAALDHVNANPGATVRDVQRAIGLAWGTTVHHLRRLERAGLLAVRRDGGQRGHWPLGQAPPRDGLSSADRAMASLVKASPGLPQRDLARLTGVGAPAACKRLARLESAGLVTQVQDGRSRLYVPTATLLALAVPPLQVPLRSLPVAPPVQAVTA